MKKGLIYYFVLASLLFHLLVILGLRHISWQQARLQKQDREPVAIDVIGPLKHGEETAIPKSPENQQDKGSGVVEAEPEKEKPDGPVMTARAAPQRQAPPSPPPAPHVKALPSPAPEQGGEVAAPRPLPPAPAPAQRAPDTVEKPSTGRETYPAGPEETATPPETAAAGQPRPGAADAEPEVPGLPGGGEAPRRLVQPSVEDLMRYAKVDKQVKRVEPEQGITLDTTDLMYTSYLRGLRRRIEMVWQYPDTAQRDGLQGELVMRFSIARSGKVESIELLKSSGYPLLDRAAEKALTDASPFNPLPESWQKERFVITGTFIYKLYGLYIR